MTRKKLKKPKKAKKKKRKREEKSESAESDGKSSEGEQSKEEAKPSTSTESAEPSGADIWREAQQVVEEKSRDAEFEEYLQDLFLWISFILQINSWTVFKKNKCASVRFFNIFQNFVKVVVNGR